MKAWSFLQRPTYFRQLTLITGLLLLFLGLVLPTAAVALTCPDGGRTLNASVVVFDQPLMWNRLGAQNINGIIYALRRDMVDMTTGLPESAGGNLVAGNVALRPDKGPRPLVLRVAAGDCLTVRFENMLAAQANPFNAALNGNGIPPFNLDINDQVAERFASFHVTGAQLRNSARDDGSRVGENPNSLVAVGGRRTYQLYFEKEGQYVINSLGATFGGEGQGGNTAGGLFGMVAVEPKNSAFYRSQVNRDEMNRLRSGRTDAGHPVINYNRRYPNREPYLSEGKANLPVANIICTARRNNANGVRMCRRNEIVHSDINAIIGYGGAPNTGRFRPTPAGNLHAGKLGHFPDDTYPLESVGRRNPSVPNRLEPFREFASLFHDEAVTKQAFPQWFEDPVMQHTLHGVRDSFMINYRSGGIGTEIISSRLGVGPMHDCLNCAYEEFFLTSFTVGDPGILVDVPANVGLEECAPDLTGCADVGPKANFALYPDDPANVHHSYTGDFVKYRNVHAGPAEQHIFHLHNHQWLWNANDDNSNYLDAQGLGPGAGYTYEIVMGGSGNRNKTSGDAIYHCHFYPHFAQGMWYLWRVHDVFEEGTVLQAMNTVNGVGRYAPFTQDGLGLGNGTPRNRQLPNGQFQTIPDTNRALPDGEIVVGTPIPGVLPLPAKAMAPIPGRVRLVSKDAGSPLTPGVPDGVQDSSQANVIDRDVNPGYPFFIAGIEHSVGQRPTTPPLDMITPEQAAAQVAGNDPLATHPGYVAGADGWDGGLPRFTVEGYLGGGESVQVQTRLDFSKDVLVAKPYFYPETGTDVEKAKMRFESQRCHDSFLPDGTPVPCTGLDFTGDTLPDEGGFIVNGAPPVPGAPYQDPCVDDQGALLADGYSGSFFSGEGLDGMNTAGNSIFNATSPRIYKAANVQFDAVFNKLGYHFPQERIITLWEDVIPTIDQRRPPEPFVMRLNTFDCANYHHANLIPKIYELDDYQVRTPTDIIGQHIHLPKWDLTTADGAANGWNYEDGTLSPQMVVEMIEAINAFNTNPANTPVTTNVAGGPVVASDNHSLTDTGLLEPSDHPYFGAVDPGDPNGFAGKRWAGARTTTQRWFADPVVNTDGFDRGLGIIFTHDHYGPSTHQQVGLYATVLTEPAGSVWRHNETGVQLGDSSPGVNPAGRMDGGPTSWQAAIITSDDPLSDVGAGTVEDFREFYFEYSDFQHAYEKGVFVGVGPDGLPITPYDINNPWGDVFLAAENLPAAIGADFRETFRFAIQPPVREAVGFPDILESAVDCPGPLGAQPERPCPEAITADDPGMFVANYRNEPLLPRVFNPDKIGPDGRAGAQADGRAGDLGFALQSRTDRVIAELNTQLGAAPAGYAGDPLGEVFLPPITQLSSLDGGDPFTPMLRAYSGDRVHIKMQVGATEEEHATTLHGLKWLQGGSGHGKAGNSGWRNSQTAGISEQFTLRTPVGVEPGQRRNRTPGDPFLARTTDYLYSHDAAVDGWAQGIWGLMRNYTFQRRDLFTLPDNRRPATLVANGFDFFKFGEGFSICPRSAPRRSYDVTAVLANDVLPANANVTNLTFPGFLPGDHAGGPLLGDGTLVYNSRPDVVGGQAVIDEETGEVITLPMNAGPLHDPTAILYVLTSDLKGVGCTDVLDPACAVVLKATAPVEPPVLRAAAGECIDVTLRNRLPELMPDLPNRNALQQTIVRNRNLGDPLQGVTWFGNNHIRPSAEAGLHPAMVEYDVSRDDGVNVGLNEVQTVPPGGKRTYRWYAGHLEPSKASGSVFVRLTPTPVEFGGFNIAPADKIKQHQKGMIAAGAVYPEGAVWATDAGTHAAATVKAPSLVRPFRDFTSIWQKNLNFYYADGDSVQNTEAEGLGVNEDPEDGGHMALNYATEPMWFRFGLNPDDNAGLRDEPNARAAYSNALVGGDPETPIFTAAPGDAFRMHLLMPTGTGRKSAPTLHGHAWQRDPYVCPGDDYEGLLGRCNPAAVGSRAIGENPVGFDIGAFQSFEPSSHFEIVSESAGGANAIPADYLYRDHMGLGNLDGLWGIMRVGAAAAPAAAPAAVAAPAAAKPAGPDGFVDTTPPPANQP